MVVCCTFCAQEFYDSKSQNVKSMRSEKYEIQRIFMKFCRQAASWKNKRKHRKTKENLFFLVFVLFLNCFSNMHLSASLIAV